MNVRASVVGIAGRDLIAQEKTTVTFWCCNGEYFTLVFTPLGVRCL